jgi:hypothetical protein
MVSEETVYAEEVHQEPIQGAVVQVLSLCKSSGWGQDWQKYEFAFVS